MIKVLSIFAVVLTVVVLISIYSLIKLGEYLYERKYYGNNIQGERAPRDSNIY